MDPISALSIVTGIVTFANFGTTSKLPEIYVELSKSEISRPAALIALKVELRSLSNNAADTRARI